jgi:hypothetical protein
VLCAIRRPKLDAALADLVRSELVFRRGTPPDATYSCKHALVRDTAYSNMLNSQRVLRHRQIAAALEKGNRDGTAIRPELLAYHHQEGGNAAAALHYWQAAADQALARSAVLEAVTDYHAAVALLGSVQALEPCAEVELRLRMRLGNAAFQTEGLTSSSMILRKAKTNGGPDRAAEEIEKPCRAARDLRTCRQYCPYAGTSGNGNLSPARLFLPVLWPSTKRLVETYSAEFAVPCRLMGFNIAGTGAAITRGTS